MSRLAVLGVGGNMGDAKETIQLAIEKLSMVLGDLDASSSFYETNAWGYENQPNFINAVTGFITDKDPLQVLEACLNIERELGRNRVGVEKWSQRLIDIDVLYVDDLEISTEKLTLPHSYIEQRNFVLVPLNEVYPEYLHPGLKMTSKELLEACTDKGMVKKI